MHFRTLTLLTCLLPLLAGRPVAAQERPPTERPVQDLSLEELLNVEVTSVARKAQRLSDSAAAVYVLSRADIRRSGVGTLPDALRLVPGVQVARIDANKWAVSVRGFNSRFANKLLVLVDGWSAYSPLYSGVFWETLDLPLDEIDRIEVIRGPGGTMWGANAVNGVINIITTNAHESEGASIAVAGDTDGPGGTATVRGGWHFGESGAARAYIKGFDRASGAGPALDDDWDVLRGGFRLDAGPAANGWSTQGTFYEGRLGQTLGPQPSLPQLAGYTNDTVQVDGAQLSTAWTRTLAGRSVLSWRAFVDHSHRAERLVEERRNTLDVDVQHRFAVARAQDVVWGGGYRASADDVVGTAFAAFSPRSLTMHWASAFVQDEIALPGAIRVTAGAKLERTTFTGVNLQPSVRALWSVSARHGLWASASRAVRMPSRAEVSVEVAVQSLPPNEVNPLPTQIVLEATRRSETERLVAYEAGYRGQLGSALSIDVSAFANAYSGISRQVTGDPVLRMGSAGPYLRVPIVGIGDATRASRGAEVAVEWHPRASVRIVGAYTALEIDEIVPAVRNSITTAGSAPRHQLVLRAHMDLPHGLELDPAFRAVSMLEDGSAEGYRAIDIRVGHRVSRALDVSLIGRNLLGGKHIEFQPTIVNTVPSAVRPSLGLGVTWRF